MIIFRLLICIIIITLAFAISCAAAFVSAGVAADVSEQFKSLQCFGGLGLMFGLLYVFAPGSLLAFVLGGLAYILPARKTLSLFCRRLLLALPIIVIVPILCVITNLFLGSLLAGGFLLTLAHIMIEVALVAIASQSAYWGLKLCSVVRKSFEETHVETGPA